MKRVIAAVAALPLILTVGPVVVASPAQADDRRCVGRIGAVSIDKDVVVPEGRTCRLIGTRIDGNVKVRSGALLIARKVRVDGNIQAAGAKRVVVEPRSGKRSRVEGSIQLKNGRRGGEIRKVVVGGDIQLFSNRGRFGVRRNVVDGNLQCKSNKPRPVGGGNRVHGNKEDQCKRL